VFLGFEHVVVNMYYVPVGMIVGANVSSAKYIAQSLIPSFIGNVIGALLRE
jgi:formate/nitrite transporter FocA (FNT family)